VVLNDHRDTAEKYLIPIANRFIKYDPNTLSWISLIFAILAGISFAVSKRPELMFESIFIEGLKTPPFLLIGVLFIFLNALFDAVDGKVARLTNRTSKQGDLLDHVLDRYADIFIIGGITFSGYCDERIGFIAIIAVLLTSYMGTQAQALGCGRNYGGLLGRADRLMILLFAPIIQYLVIFSYHDGYLPIPYHEFTVLELILVWFIVAGNITAIHRAVKSWEELGEEKEKGIGRRNKPKK